MTEREPDQIPLQEVPSVRQSVPVVPRDLARLDASEHTEDRLPALRTYSSDLADAIHKEQGSIVRIALAEEKKHQKDEENISPVSAKNIGFIAGTLAVLAIAVGLVAGALWYKKQSAPVQTGPSLPQALVHIESAAQVEMPESLSRDSFLQALRSAVANSHVPAGSVLALLPTKTAAGAQARISSKEFLSLLAPHAPTDLVRSLGDTYMLGIYSLDSQNLFYILQGTAHDYMLTGMLAWEPYLIEDTGPLFGFDVQGRDASLTQIAFSDAIIENRDARAILSADKKPLLFYSFLDPNSVIIATDPKTLTEAVRRFGR